MIDGSQTHWQNSDLDSGNRVVRQSFCVNLRVLVLLNFVSVVIDFSLKSSKVADSHKSSQYGRAIMMASTDTSAV
jgi:hypothetical protein